MSLSRLKAKVAQLVERPDKGREGLGFKSFDIMFYTYILQSEKNGRYYVGHTADLKERLNYHNTGKVTATRNRGPWLVKYYEIFETKIQANQRELEIKKKKSRKFIEFLINNKRK